MCGEGDAAALPEGGREAVAESEGGGDALSEAVAQRDALGVPLPKLSVGSAVGVGGGSDAVGGSECEPKGVAEAHAETEGVAHADAAADKEEAADDEGGELALEHAVTPLVEAEAGAVALPPPLPVTVEDCEGVPVAHAVAHPLPLPVALLEAEGPPPLEETAALTESAPVTEGGSEGEAQAVTGAETLPAALRVGGGGTVWHSPWRSAAATQTARRTPRQTRSAWRTPRATPTPLQLRKP